jgi:hypothetical protein
MNLKDHTKPFLTFSWRVVSIHSIAYFIAGICAFLFNFNKNFDLVYFSLILRPLYFVQVASEAGLQVIHGFLLSLFLYPIKDAFLKEKTGWLKLLVLIFGLSYVSNIRPTFGSFQAYTSSKIFLKSYLLGIPEALIHTFLFSFFIPLWYRKEHKAWNITTIVVLAIIVIINLLGVLFGHGITQSQFFSY